jgi:hypothetical protein
VNEISGSKAAAADAAGLAQLYTTVTALTVKGETITSCAIDAVQAKVEFDATGAVTTDLTAPVLTKNELGDNYGMKKASSIGAEWNTQAASFASYITGKTAADVAAIAVDEKTAPTDADLTASVTVKIGGFQELIAKAAGADFVKTSTGFSTGGATPEDVALMRKTVGKTMGVKAAGGIRTLEDAMKMIEAGANRIGCSAGVSIIEALPR